MGRRNRLARGSDQALSALSSRHDRGYVRPVTTPYLSTIDCEYVSPGLAAAYLRVQGDEAAFIETNTTLAVPRLLAALAEAGRAPAQVRYVVVTHVHLDHAGGASALMAACPHATLLAHPRAARHLIDPSKLVASARGVYGDARFDALYGAITPIDAARVQSLDDGAAVALGDATLRFWHVRGHANHHFVVHDEARDTVFTGDAFGLAYPRLQRAGRFAYPSTSPTDFDAAAALASVDRILALGTRSACLTHFGEIADLPAVATQLREWLNLSDALVQAHAGRKDAEAPLRARLEAEFQRRADAIGLALDAEDRALIDFDLALNAQGLAVAASKLA
jgi:glyoxylase-like metal-dependent hydrolase (beta-lactamase superfamily II)